MKTTLRYLICCMILAQVFTNRLAGGRLPQAFAYNFAKETLAQPLAQSDCAFWSEESRYDGEEFTMRDRIDVTPSTYFWVVNQASSKVRLFNVANLGNPNFEQLSEIIPKGMSSVYVARSLGLKITPTKNGTPNQAQVVFRMTRTAYAQDADQTPGKIVTTDNYPLTQITVNKKASGAPVAGGGGFSNPQFENECYNVTINYCGDGIVQSNKGEQCDDGNQNNNDSCNNQCQPVVAIPQCVYEQITTNPQLNQPVQVKCGAPTGFIGVNILVKKDGVNFYAPQTPVMASQHTFSFTPNAAGNYTYECLEYYNVPTPPGSVSCGGSFTIAGQQPQCTSLSVNPALGTAPLTVNYNCTGINSSDYLVTAFLQDGSEITKTTKQGSFTNLPAGVHSIQCLVGGASSAACNKTVSVQSPVQYSCNNLKVFANGTQIQNGAQSAGTFPITISYTASAQGVLSCSLKESVNGNLVTRGTITGTQGTFPFLINNSNAYRVYCTVNGLEPNGTTNTCNADFRFPPLAQYDLSLTKTVVGNQTYNSGDLVSFDVVVTNSPTATAAANGVTVNDYLPATFELVNAGGGQYNAATRTITWTNQTFAIGESKTYTITVRALQAGSNQCNKAEVCSYLGETSTINPHDPDSTPCSMGANGQPNVASEDDEAKACINVNNPVTPYIDIEVEKSLVNPAHNMFDSGEVATFTIVVTNNGNTAANNFSIKDYLPPLAFAIGTVTASNGGVVQGNIVTWNGLSLLPGQSLTLTLSMQLKFNSVNPDPCNFVEAGNYEINGGPQDADSNGFNMAGPAGPVHEDDESKVCFRVNHPENPNYDVELEKIVTTPAGQLVSGGLVQFQITVHNNSNVAIPTLSVKDYLPANIQFVSASNGGVQVVGQTIQWTIAGGLAAQETKSVYLTGKILKAGRYDNCAEAGNYNGASSTASPKDIDSNPFNHPGQDVEDDESCAGFDVPTPNNPVSCTNLTVNPQNGTAPLTVTYNCTALNASTYTIQLIQNGVVTTIGNTPTGTYTITNQGNYQIQCLVDGTVTNANCSKSVSTTPTPYIDLNIKKLFADTNTPDHANFNSGDAISFKLIVGNSGTTTATNFTVRDYMPTSLQYVSSTPNGIALGNNQYQWSIASLAPGQTTTITIQAKIILAVWEKNRTEVCAYEEAGEPQDPDSDPCNMGPTGMPSEDDEDMIMRDVNEPNSPAACINLNIDTTTGTVPYTVTYDCAGDAATSYVVKLFGGNLGANGLVVGSAPQGSFVLNNTGSYTVQCFVNGNVTSNACKKTLVGTKSGTGTGNAKCNYMTVTPTNGTSPLNVNYFCNGGFVTNNDYVISIVGPNNYYNSLTVSGGTIQFTQPGSYTLTCTAGGATSPACTKVVTVQTGTQSCLNGATNYPDCNDCPPSQTYSNGQCVPTTTSSGVQCLDLVVTPVAAVAGQTVNFSCYSLGGSVHQIYIYKDSINTANLVATLYGAQGSYTFANGGNYIAQCIVDGGIDYKLDYYKNASVSLSVCGYKQKPNNQLCAVQPALAPYVASFIPLADYATMPAPIEYCNASELSYSCATNPNNYGVVKNHEACKEQITVQATCPNGATNYPACNQCPSGYSYNGTVCIPNPCVNGATNPPACNQCPAGMTIINGICQFPGGGGYNPYGYCGNGILEIGEYCDLGNNSDRLIRSGPYAGKQCNTNCTITNETNPPKCADIDPPSINQGEYLPFRRRMDTTSSAAVIVNSCTNNAGKIDANSMSCTFNVYNGLQKTKKIVLPCNTNSSIFSSKLMQYRNTYLDDTAPVFGKHALVFDSSFTNGIYGEYKIELAKIDYRRCGDNTPYSFDGRVCQYNFIVGSPYLIQKGAKVSTMANSTLDNYYGFRSNTTYKFNEYLRNITQSLQLSSFTAPNISYLTDDFVAKYDKLAGADKSIGFKKVPGRNIYIYSHSVTLSSDQLDNDNISDGSTIIVEGGSLTLNGNITKRMMYVVPNGTITFAGDANCTDRNIGDNAAHPQVVAGIFIAGQGFDSDNYHNSNQNASRCSQGGLKILGTLIGTRVDILNAKRRVVLDNWFVGGENDKIKHILDGASLLIDPNTTLWDLLPGANEVAKVLGVSKN